MLHHASLLNHLQSFVNRKHKLQFFCQKKKSLSHRIVQQKGDRDVSTAIQLVFIRDDVDWLCKQ